MTYEEDKINRLAMSIVNFTNETNKVDVKTRQKNNDKCFDFAIKKIKEYFEEKAILEWED